mgnify:CR=1 FL=1
MNIDNITSVRGIKAWGAHSGVKSLRRDLALIVSEKPGVASATFTQNLVVAEPVKLSREHLKSGMAQAIVINAGNANACTGEQGMKGARAMAKTMAEEYSIAEELVIVASTGIIGKEFPTEEVVSGIRENAKKVSDKPKAGTFAANAILTTDTFAKEGFNSFNIGEHKVNMAGIAKGSGMIHPNMATMLAFVVTDCAISKPLLDKAFKRAVELSFNRITVDGDTSTNDMAMVLANGMAENPEITDDHSEHYQVFKDNLTQLLIHLAKLIVSDGEGASKFVEYRVVDAPDEASALQIMRTVSNSTLVKAAMFGRDPNWGRILAAAGRSGVQFNPDKVDLYIGDADRLVKIVENGREVEENINYLKKLLRDSHVRITLSLNDGSEEVVGWGTDLTTDYVMFNSVYTT